MTGQHGDELDPVQALSAMVTQLRGEREGLLTAMRNRAVIEQAKGLLVERMAISPEDAFEHLVELSTHHNVKLAELAASLVASRAPGPAVQRNPVIDASGRNLTVDAVLGRLPGPEVPRPDATPVPASEEELRARHRLMSSRVASATTTDELAATLLGEGAGWPPPAAVMVLATEADGALRLVGSAGLRAEVRSQWERVPPIEDLPIVAAARSRTPLVVSEASDGGPSLAAVPLVHQDSVLGVVALSWESPLLLGEEARTYLSALGGPCSQRYVELTGSLSRQPDSGTEEGRTDVSVLPLLVEALRRPAVVLIPVHDDQERVVDFRPMCGSPAAMLLAEAEQLTVRTSLLAVLPQVGSQVLLPALTEVAQSGKSIDIDNLWISSDREGTRHSYMIDLHVARLWDRLLATWHLHTDAELLHEQLLFSEEAWNEGSFRWDPRTEVALWSPGLYRLIGRRPADGPVALDEIDGYVDADDLDTVPNLIERVLSEEAALNIEVRGAGQLQGRRLGVVIEPEFDPDGSVRAVRGTVRDITDSWSTDARLHQAEVMIAAQRGRIADETPVPPPLESGVDGIEVVGLAGGPSGWYDIDISPDGGLTLIVGEVGGEDTTVVARGLRQVSTGYAVAGMSPVEIVTKLNTYVCRREPGAAVTVTVVHVAPGGREVQWSVAGRAVPLLFPADGDHRLLAGTLGLPLGVSEDASYGQAGHSLAIGDRLLAYPESLLGDDIAAGLAELLATTAPTGITALTSLAGNREIPVLMATVVERSAPRSP